MSSTSDAPKKLRIAYLGPKASFSHQAALESFPSISAESFAPLPSFEAILSAIQSSSPQSPEDESTTDYYDYALLPVENSTNGGVVPVLDLLVQTGQQSKPRIYPDVEIVGEHYLQVHHNLFCHHSIVDRAGSKDLKDLDIRVLYSHPQVWGQCGRFLTQNFPLPDVERIHMSSTSAAAAFVAQSSSASTSTSTATTVTQVPKASKSGNIAAICSSLAGEQNNLVNLAANIEDEPGQNTTRFFIIRNRQSKSDRDNQQISRTATIASATTAPVSWKSLVTFTIAHTMPGSLAAALAVFSKNAFNLTAITTRPSRERSWHYVFFVECEEERTDSGDGSKVQTMFKELSDVTERSSLLGSWVNRLKHER